MKRFVLLSLILGATVMQGLSQVEEFTRHYLLNPILVNPAYTGFRTYQNLVLNYQNQWSNFEGAPNTLTASYNAPINEHIGLGASLTSDNAADLVRNRTQLSYAYKFIINDFNLALGLSTTFERSRLKGSALLDTRLDRDDPFIIDAANGNRYFDAAFGVHGEVKEFYFGLASPNLVRARVNQDPQVDNETSSGLLEHYLAYVGYKWMVEDNNFYVEPSLLIRNLRGIPTTIDVNGKVYLLEDQLIGGLSYTLGGGDRFSLLLGTSMTKFDMYYSYTSSFQQSQQYHGGVHELSMQFTFGDRKKTLEDAN